MTEVIKLSKVSKYFGAHIKAVDNVSLSIEEGEFVAIHGPSGSGKTTLLNIMAGIDSPDKGRIVVDGVEPKGIRDWVEIRSRKMGFIFQAFNLLPTLTALENIEIRMYGIVKSSREREQRAFDLLKKVGLETRANHRPTQLSGGECQRVAIARALANYPKFVLADEPTGNLDSKTSDKILDLLATLHQSNQITLIMVTHEKDIASRATRVLSYGDGKIISDIQSSF
ncbi:MAG TPA: ABC transporter ATP-binding protein [Desulfobacterales bacterium]|nr:ABC transporter ATP-binding protein [Desulfobacterales bacterium]